MLFFNEKVQFSRSFSGLFERKIEGWYLKEIIKNDLKTIEKFSEQFQKISTTIQAWEKDFIRRLMKKRLGNFYSSETMQ